MYVTVSLNCPWLIYSAAPTGSASCSTSAPDSSNAMTYMWTYNTTVSWQSCGCHDGFRHGAIRLRDCLFSHGRVSITPCLVCLLSCAPQTSATGTVGLLRNVSSNSSEYNGGCSAYFSCYTWK